MIFVNFDTVRQCVWPYYERKQCRKNSQVDLSKEPVGRSEDLAGRKLESCDFHSWLGAWIFANISLEYLMHPPLTSGDPRLRQLFVFPTNPNTWSWKWGDDMVKVRKIWPEHLQPMIRYVGMDFVMGKSFDPRTMVNVIPPLLWNYKAMEVSPEARQVCQPRPVLASFVGRMTSVLRKKIAEQHNEAAGIIAKSSGNTNYTNLLLNSTFGLAPRGDNHYSFRLAEVVAAGAIPVLLDSRAVLPWGHNSIDAWAVSLTGKSVLNVEKALRTYSQDDICRMKRAGGKIMDNLRDMRGMVNAMLLALHATVKPSSSL